MKPEPRGLAALAAQVEHYRLIFRWPERTASLLFPGLLILSVAIHTFAFFIFQVVYPPTVASAPPRAQVTLLTPGTPHSDALLRWVEAQDPATAGRIQEIAPKGLEEIRYTPSYEAARMPLKEGEPSAAPLGLISAYSLLDASFSKKPTTVESASLSVASSLAFSEPLRARESATPPQPLEITTKSSANLRPTVFLVGIGDRGEVLYCFLQESSADRAMDTQAEALLRQHVFTHSETPLEWGFATFTWGAEAFALRSSQPPTPQTATSQK